MADNQMEVKNTLNFFQRVRKNMYLNSLTPEKAAKYKDLPLALRQDSEIIERAMEENSEANFAELPYNEQVKWVIKNPDFINKITNRKYVAKLVNEVPSLITAITDTNLIYAMVYERNIGEFAGDFDNHEFLKCLPIEMQKTILKGVVRYKDANDNEKIGNLMRINKETKDFSEECYIELAISDALKYGEEKTTDIVTALTLLGVDVSTLSEDAQLKLLLIHPVYMQYVSSDIALKFVGDNPYLASCLPYQLKATYFEEHPELMCVLDSKDMQALMNRGEFFNFSNYSSAQDILYDLVSKEYVSSNYLIYGYTSRLDNATPEMMWELAKLDPELIRAEPAQKTYDTAEGIVFDTNSLININNSKIAKLVHDKALEYDPKSKIAAYLEKLREGDFYKVENSIELNMLLKFVSDETIMKKLTSTQIMDYIKYPSHQNLAEIIGVAYGDTALQIVLERPKLWLDIIRTTKIFDPEIIKEFGIGATHSYISYKMESAGIISDFAMHPEQLKEYRKFNKILGGIYENTAQDLDRKLKAFAKCREIMKNVDLATLNNKQLHELEIVLNDSIDKEHANMILPFPKTLDELTSYRERKDKWIDAAIAKASSALVIKKLMAKKFFGMNYETSMSEYLDRPSLQGMCRFYKMGEISKDERLIKNGTFTKEELDAIGLLDVFNSITSPKILRELNDELSANRDSMLDPTAYREIQNKVQRHYARVLTTSLINLDKAKDMSMHGEQGIEVTRDEEGFDVVTLKGCQFYCYVTNPNLNLSRLTLKGNDISETWNTLEEGVSTISGSVISPGARRSWLKDDDIGLGFGVVDPEEIVGLSSTDINMTHAKKVLRPRSDAADKVEFNLPTDHEKEKAIREVIKDKWEDPSHPVDELAMSRRKLKLDEITENSRGGRIMPDYVIINTHDNDTLLKYKLKDARELATKFGTKTIFVVNNSAYPERLTFMAATREREEVPLRGQSRFINNVKKFSNRGEDYDER